MFIIKEKNGILCEIIFDAETFGGNEFKGVIYDQYLHSDRSRPGAAGWRLFAVKLVSLKRSSASPVWSLWENPYSPSWEGLRGRTGPLR